MPTPDHVQPLNYSAHAIEVLSEFPCVAFEAPWDKGDDGLQQVDLIFPKVGGVTPGQKSRSVS
jgi:hypothetical protein